MQGMKDVALSVAWLFDVLPVTATIMELRDDGEAVVRAVNPRWVAANGYQRDEVVGRSLAEFQPRAIADQVAGAMERALAGTEPVDIEIETEVPTGPRVFGLRLLALPDLGERHVLTLTVDRSDTIRAEAALDETQALARLGHWSWDPAADLITWTPQLWKILGRVEEEHDAPGFDLYVEAVHPDDRPELLAEVERIQRDGGSYTLRHRILRPDGEERVLDAVGRAVTDDAGRLVRLAGTAQDVTEQVRLQTEAVALREANRLHEEGLELNDNVMQGLAVARLALMTDDPDGALEAIDRTTRNARGIISRLLDSRIEREGPLKPGSLVRNSRALEESS
jgi:PAS domain S-box-containing protein